jgi:hypothetical protein
VSKPDNLPPPPARSLGVTSGDLERRLRQSLAQAADPAHAVGGPDPAGRAIRRARRIGRRRSVAGVALVAVATAAATVGVAQLNTGDPRYAGPAWVGDPTPLFEKPETTYLDATRPPSETSPQLQREQLSTSPLSSVDLVLTSQLRTASGGTVDLRPVGVVTQAHEAKDGWLVVGVPPTGGSTLWYIRPDGGSREVLPAVDAVALAPDGRRVAWRDSARLFSAVIDDGNVKDATQTSAPAQGLPISFVGQGVVMARGRAGAGQLGYDVWWPRPGTAYTPRWKEDAAGIYGPLPDGRTLVAQVSPKAGSRPCLALLDAVNALSVLKTACALQLKAGGPGSVSPDGQWLMAGTDTPVAMLIDLRVAFTKEPTAVAAGPAMTDQATWTDADTILHASSDGRLVRVRAGAKPEVEQVEVPGATADTKVVVVKRLMV